MCVLVCVCVCERERERERERDCVLCVFESMYSSFFFLLLIQDMQSSCI